MISTTHLKSDVLYCTYDDKLLSFSEVLWCKKKKTRMFSLIVPYIIELIAGSGVRPTQGDSIICCGCCTRRISLNAALEG